MLGVAEGVLAHLVADVTVPSASDGGLTPAERFARGVFTFLAEPGDAAAGLLLRAIGPKEALSFVVRRCSVEVILARIGDQEARESLSSVLPEALQRWGPRVSSKDAIDAFRHAAQIGASLVVPSDPAWPAGLDGLGDHAPAALWVRGDATRLGAVHHGVAMVGARAATSYGTQVAAEFASGLADRGIPVISGAAYGIDGMAHRAVLAAGGETVAFLAGGADRLYPSGHSELLTRIIHEGCVVAEMPCGSAPTRWRFLQRNRLIAACAAATVVVEAGKRSGSLNTAGHAAQLGRALGAVPGPISSPASVGCHRLVRDYGAVLVTSVEEVLELLGPDAVASKAGREGCGGEEQRPPTDPSQVRILDALGRRALTVDELAARSGMAPGDVAAALGTLQLTGAAHRREGGWVRARR